MPGPLSNGSTNLSSRTARGGLPGLTITQEIAARDERQSMIESPKGQDVRDTVRHPD